MDEKQTALKSDKEYHRGDMFIAIGFIGYMVFQTAIALLMNNDISVVIGTAVLSGELYFFNMLCTALMLVGALMCRRACKRLGSESSGRFTTLAVISGVIILVFLGLEIWLIVGDVDDTRTRTGYLFNEQQVFVIESCDSDEYFATYTVYKPYGIFAKKLAEETGSAGGHEISPAEDGRGYVLTVTDDYGTFSLNVTEHFMLE